MTRRQLFAGLGTLLLVIGVFSPIAKIFWVEIDYYKDGEGDGVIILILLALTVPLLLIGRWTRIAWLLIALMAIILVYDFFDTYDIVSDVGSLGWGWIPLFAGEVLLIAAAASGKKTVEVIGAPE